MNEYRLSVFVVRPIGLESSVNRQNWLKPHEGSNILWATYLSVYLYAVQGKVGNGYSVMI